MNAAAFGGIRNEQSGAAASARSAASGADQGSDFAALLGAAKPAERPVRHERSGAATDASAAHGTVRGKAAASRAQETSDKADPAPSTVAEEDETAAATDAQAASADPASTDTVVAADAAVAGTPPVATQFVGDWLSTMRASLRLAGDGAVAAAGTGAVVPSSLTARAASASGGDAAGSLPSFAESLQLSAETAPALAGEGLKPTAPDLMNVLATAMPTGDAAPLVTSAVMSHPSTTTSGAGTAPLAPAMTLPPEHPDFPEALAERIVWITDAGLSSARIEMNPQNLGAVSVHVQLRNDEAQVAFAADNPMTRAMLQQAMPQLRELFAGQGLQLLRSQIEQRSAGSREAGGSAGFSSSRSLADATTATRRVSRLQLVDAYV